MIWQPGLLYHAGILTFALLISSGCTSKDHADAGDIGNSDKQDVSYDVHEVSDIDESSDTFNEPKDTELLEDVKNDSGSDDVDDSDVADNVDADAANDEDVDEEYEAELRYLDGYYSTNMSGSLVQYQQWLIVQPEFMRNAQSGYVAEFLVYNKNSPYQLTSFSGHPEHQYISGGPGGSARPIVRNNHLFVVGMGTLSSGNNVSIPSIRIYDLTSLPQSKDLQEIHLNEPVVGLDLVDVGCTSFDKITSDLSFFIIKDAVVVICDGQIIRHALLKDANDLFYIGESEFIASPTIIRSYNIDMHQTSDGNVYLIMESEGFRTRDVFSLSQDGILTKISNIQLPQYEVRGELIQPTFAYKKPEWINNHLWVPTDKGPFAAVFDMSDPAQPTFLHYTQTFGTFVRLHASGPYVFALVSSASATSFCTEELFDDHCLDSAYDVMVYNRDSPSPVSSLSNVIELDTDGDGYDNYSSIGDIVFDDPMLYLTQTHNYTLDTSTQRGILKIDLRERLLELPF